MSWSSCIGDDVRSIGCIALFFLNTLFSQERSWLEEMSIEEKVGQLLMVHFHGEVANEDAKVLVQDLKVGGILYYNWSNGLTSPSQVQSLSEGLQKLAKENGHPIPLLIAADQEGGVVARLQSGFTIFPGNRALGETGDPSLAERASFAMGEELRAVGINMNLAPVVDVNSHPKNPVIGIRSFGESPETVAAFGEKALVGFRQAGVIATLKHFPGYGDVAVDPHEDLPRIDRSKEELERVELLPFAKLASSADAIMTAHILVPALDPENCSTLSEKTLQYLREKIGFQGVIVADSLVMDGVLKKCQSVDEASLMALNAGCDLLILGGKLLMGEHAGFELTVADVQRIHSFLVQAVKKGVIAEEKLDRAVERILELKERYSSSPMTLAPLHKKVGVLEHRVLAQKIGSLALKVTEKKPTQIGSLKDRKIFVVAPTLLEPTLASTSLFQLGKSTNSYFFQGLNPSESEIESAERQAVEADAVIICSYNAWKNPSAIALAQKLSSLGKPVILLVVRDPLDATLLPQAHLMFKSFSPTVPSIQAICDHIGALR